MSPSLSPSPLAMLLLKCAIGCFLAVLVTINVLTAMKAFGRAFACESCELNELANKLAEAGERRELLQVSDELEAAFFAFEFEAKVLWTFFEPPLVLTSLLCHWFLSIAIGLVFQVVLSLSKLVLMVFWQTESWCNFIELVANFCFLALLAFYAKALAAKSTLLTIVEPTRAIA